MPQSPGPALAGLSADYLRRLEIRFHALVEIDLITGCHNWRGCCHSTGYGIFSIGGRSDGRHVSAHRVAWELVHGPIPPDKLIRHRHCHNRRCVNVEHLATGTHQENMSDMTGARRGHTKLTDKEAAIVPGLAMLEWAPKEIATALGASVCLIQFILNGTRRQNAVDAELDQEEQAHSGTP